MPVVTGEDFDILTDEPFWEEVKKDVLRRLLPSFQKLLLAGVDFGEAARITYKALDEVLTGDKQLPLPVDYDKLTTELLDFLPTYTDKWWSELDVITRDQLRASMTASIAAGESPDKLVKRLDPTFGKARANRIATTETTRLFNEGSKRTYEAAGVERVQWRSVHDNAVCPECEALDGEEWPINAVPTDPPIHVLCRCYLAPVVSKDLKPKAPEETRLRTPQHLSAREMKQSQQAISKYMSKSGSPSSHKVRSEAKAKLTKDLARVLEHDAKFQAAIARGRSSELERIRGCFANKDTQKIVNEMIQSWSVSSSDANLHSLGLQRAVVQEFGLEGKQLASMLKGLSPGSRTTIATAWEEVGPAYQRFARVMYDNTQRELAAAGIDELVLVRGMRFDQPPSWLKDLPQGEWVPISSGVLNPISSFSSQEAIAKKFTKGAYHRVMTRVVVPRERVLATPWTGVGCLSEYELVVLETRGEWSLFYEVATTRF